MKQHQVYSINDTEAFDAKDYTALTAEIDFIVKQTAGMLPQHKADIMISYFKDHAIMITWITANPLLAKLVTSNVLPSANIEALFEASRTNPRFRKQLEAFLNTMLQPKNDA